MLLSGKGVIIWADHFMACAMNDCSEKVICPILTWMGGNGGKLYAESLCDVIEVGQTVRFLQFTAVVVPEVLHEILVCCKKQPWFIALLKECYRSFLLRYIN